MFGKEKEKTATFVFRVSAIWPQRATVSPRGLLCRYCAVCLLVCLLIFKAAKVTAALCIRPSSAPECSLPRFIGGVVFMVFKAVD